MALYHLTAKTGTRAAGHSALAKAQYIQREDRYARVPDAVVYTTSRNLPSFAAGHPTAYWEAADLYERRNARLFKEVEFALPVELGPAAQRALAEAFAEELLAGEKLPFTLAIHAGKGRNPHCHVLVSERVNDGLERDPAQWFRRWNARDPEHGGARKSEALKPKEWLAGIRQKWADLVNTALVRAGLRERVDHRSLQAQGVERVPQLHLGPNVIRMEKKGLRTERGDQAMRIARGNVSIAERRAELREIEATRSAQEGGRDPARAEVDPSRPPEIPSGNRAGNRSAELGAEEPLARAGSEPIAAMPTSPDAAAQRLEDMSQTADSSSDIRPRRTPDHRESEEPLAEEASRERDRTDASEHPRSALEAPGARSEGERSVALDSEDGDATAQSAASSRDRTGGDRSNRPPLDRTARAVRRQLHAMGATRFEVGIRETSSGRMMNRTWSADEVLEQLPWLKRLNAAGNDIFVRPAAESRGHGLVLVDDLGRSALGQLRRDGRAPAVVVETSPANYQAWVRVPSQATEAERGEIARRLAHDYGGDPASAAAHHYGRLAGFTNRKPEHRDAQGLHPFARLRAANGRAAPDGQALLRDAARGVEARRTAPSRIGGTPEPGRADHPSAQREATESCRRHLQELALRLTDRSQCDFVAAVRLVARGHDAATVRHALREASPDLEERKRGHVDDYVRRTVEAAVKFHALARERVGRNHEPEDRER